MKREILCTQCAARIGPCPYPGEGIKKVPGKLRTVCRCDDCAARLLPGVEAVAVSMYREGGYFAWESSYVEVPHAV